MGVPGAVGGGDLAQAHAAARTANAAASQGRDWQKRREGVGGEQHLGCTSQSQAISLSSRRDLELQPRSKMLYAAP